MSDDDLIFADEGSGLEEQGMSPWPILIVDDEEEIHTVTKLALSGFEFADRPLQFLSAYSGKEAREVMQRRPDVAMVLLDVVMENDHAGLDTARYIRDSLKNRFVRIVLRTGQPGQAPERDVIRDYDINDYKEKTELTAKKLYTVVYSALRSYRDLKTIDANRRGLLKVLSAASNLFKAESGQQFIQGVLEQLSALIYDDHDMVYVGAAMAAKRQGPDEQVIAATGRYAGTEGKAPRQSLSHSDYHNLNLALRKRRSVITPEHFSGYFAGPKGTEHLLYISGNATLSAPDQELIDVFLQNVAVVYETLILREQIEAETQGDGEGR